MSASVISGMGELAQSQFRVLELVQANSQVKDHCQEEDEAGNSEVHPLHVLQRGRVICRLQEEHIGAKNGGNDCANAIERLRNVDTQLSISRRTADGDVRVCSSLQGAQTVTDNEDGRTEAPKRSMQDTRPGYKSTYSI